MLLHVCGSHAGALGRSLAHAVIDHGLRVRVQGGGAIIMQVGIAVAKPFDSRNFRNDGCCSCEPSPTR